MLTNGRLLTWMSVAAAIALGCGGGTAGTGVSKQDSSELPPPPSCTGPVPANATMCPGADANLANATPRSVVDTCTCDASCRAIVPCSYACAPGYIVVEGVCQPVAPTSAVQFADNGDGTVTVTDALGKRVWLKQADCHEPRAWLEASSWSAALADGACALRDHSAPGDWHLPSQTELMNLAADMASPAYAAAGSPFIGVASAGYWSSYTPCVNTYGVVDVTTGQYFDRSWDLAFHAWPVRR